MKYQTIVIDPPWPMGFIKLRRRPNQVEMPYPTMTIEDIKQLPISSIADSNCNLFLWTTHKYLPVQFDVLNAWGFKYHCCLVWNKTNGLSLCGFTRDTEFLLYAYRGKITVNQRGKFIRTLFTEKLRKHSQKPDCIYSTLEANSPGPRIDIFARAKRDGWDVWGNEVESDIELCQTTSL